MSSDRSNSEKKFVISILRTENHTWQGQIISASGQRKYTFRSAMELFRIMKSELKKTN